MGGGGGRGEGGGGGGHTGHVYNPVTHKRPSL